MQHERETSPKALPWNDLMAVGLGRLGLSPKVFWSMTLQELDAAMIGLSGTQRVARFARTDLSKLMATFPDEKG